MAMLTIMVSIGALAVFSLFTAINRREFSMNVFLCSAVIGITIMIWTGTFPSYFILIPILILVGMFFSGGSKEGIE
jgi:hypothetical protein